MELISSLPVWRTSPLLLSFSISAKTPVPALTRIGFPIPALTITTGTSNPLRRQPLLLAALPNDDDGVAAAASALEELRKEAEETLEWQSVCDQVARFASTSAGRALCRSGGLQFGRDRDESRRLLDQTAAAASVLARRRLDFSGVDDVLGLVRLAVSGEVLGVRELCAVERSLRAARRLYDELLEVSAGDSEGDVSSDRYSPLLDMFRSCNFLAQLVQKIGLCIDSNFSTILDQASPKLESIRSERRKNMGNIESLLKSISSKIFQAGGIDSPIVTRRRSRMCVGIRASHKSLLPDGIILGISSSGATYFVEPRDVIELNNMEVRLSNHEKAEEFAILSMLTSWIASSDTDITYLMKRILDLDLALARGAHAAWMNGKCPIFNDVNEEIKSIEDQEALVVDIEGICHPLLLESSQKRLPTLESGSLILLDGRDGQVKYETLDEAENVVPVDIKITSTAKVVVISGPNTGGKTVAMKTLGLASLMAKAGMFIPAKNRPKLPWFDQVLADIGDHQSLEHNLSTFSGHISRLCKIMEVSSKRSLVLVDEIGNGTDPSEGVVLSISILRYIVDHVKLAVVTTHYADLCNLKAKDSRFENAAMEFCIETLKPTYRILWGSTGNSNALSIAKSIGFDHKVLNRAQEWVEKLLPDKQKERQGLLYQSLLEEKSILEAQARNAASVLSEVKKLYQEIYSEAEDLDKREVALKAKESQRVRHELKAVKSQMDLVVKNFENQLQNANQNQVNVIFRQAEASIATIIEAHRFTDDSLSEKTRSSSLYVPQVGDQVRVKGLGTKLVTIVEAQGEDGSAVVQYGKIRVRLRSSDMKLIKSAASNDQRNPISRAKLQEKWRESKALTMQEEGGDEGERLYGPVVQTSKNTVDLRGMRVEEATNYLNMAIAGCRSYGVLFIVHGMGTGAIKECALNILSKHPRVARYEEESPMNYGCTVAYIK